MNSPFSLKLSLGNAHFRPVNQKAEAVFHIIVTWPVNPYNFRRFLQNEEWRATLYVILYLFKKLVKLKCRKAVE